MSDPLVLVTGASGYLGTQVVKTLQEAGYKVRGTVRSTKNAQKVQHLYKLCPGAKFEVELVEADLMSDDGWDKAVEGCTYVHHVASPFPAANPKTEEEVVRPAVDGTLRVLKACTGAKTVKRVVLTSSCAAVFARGGNTEPYSEKDWCPVDAPNLPYYYKSKILAEKAAWDYVKDLPDDDKFELATINPILIIGPTLHGTPGTSSSLITRFLLREMPMVPRLAIGVVDVRDVATAHLKAMTLPEAAGNRHILFNENMWMTDIAKILDKEFKSQGYNCPTKVMPNFMLTISGWFDKEIRDAKDAMREPALVDNTRMKSVLGITPIDPAKSLIDMGHSMIANGFIKKTAKYTGPSAS